MRYINVIIILTYLLWHAFYGRPQRAKVREKIQQLNFTISHTSGGLINAALPLETASPTSNSQL